MENNINMKNYIINKENGVSYVTFPAFEKISWLGHVFSTRLGGVSEGCFSSMNLGFERGDKEEAVEENFKRIAKAVGFLPENIVFSDQVHDVKVKRVGKDECQGSRRLSEKRLKGIDGIMTNEKDVVLVTSYADCVPLFFVDEKNHAIAASHAGWRGTVGRIGEITVKAMEKEFKTNPKDLKVVIGPSICQDCYEVSLDVAEQFMELSDSCNQIVVKSSREEGKYQLNLWLANKEILVNAGVQSENIHISGLCTCCNSELLFSHRASNGKRGGLCGFLWIGETGYGN